MVMCRKRFGLRTFRDNRLSPGRSEARRELIAPQISASEMQRTGAWAAAAADGSPEALQDMRNRLEGLKRRGIEAINE
jgi:hypothetical protein